MKRLATRRMLVAGVAAVVAALSWATAVEAVAATPQAAWRITQVAVPTAFKAGSSAPSQPGAGEASPQYSIGFTNVGGAAAEGETTVTDELPVGVSFAMNAPELNRQACDVPVGRTVTCHTTEPSQPGRLNTLSVPVSVSAQAEGPLENHVTVASTNVPASTSVISTQVSDAVPIFGLLPGQEGIAGTATSEDGQADVQAGSHPFVVTLEMNIVAKQREGVVSAQSVVPAQPLRNVGFELPPGLVVNPQATSKLCTEAQLNSRNNGEGCPAESQVGNIVVSFSNLSGVGPGGLSLYNMQPPPGHAAELGFTLLGTLVHILGGVNGTFHLTAHSDDILAKVGILGTRVNLWGDPSDERHDSQRVGNGCSECSVPQVQKPFLTMPTACHEQGSVGVSVASWLGTEDEGSGLLEDLEGNPLAMEGCNALQFSPEISSQASTNVGESPSGLNFSIRQAQNESVEGLAPAALKNASVTLPAGMTVNPAAANGLSSCSEDQIGFQPSAGKVRFETVPQTCPNSAKVGTLEVTTPLLGHKLPGSIYIAKPFANPFGSLLALYLAVEDEESGVIVKLAGKVEPDPQTGQLTATFEENPELPLEDVSLSFFEGARAALTSPLTCGLHTTTSTLTPWSTPEGADAHPTSSFQTTAGCSGSEAQAPKTVSFTAGTTSPLAGSYSPFTLRIARADGTQHITGLETTLPAGLLGKLAGVAYCPESGIAQARGREVAEKGKEEQSSPSCPPSSEVGTVQVTAGSGISPIPVSGHAYLAGPYKGAPLSLVVIVPAVAGPFDLGTVVDRVALDVGEYDAKIHAVADPLPTIRDGIPLDVRSIELKLDRPNFTLNPTSCEVKAIEGSVSTQAGQSATLNNRFQVGECGRLAFKPKVAISLKGATKRTGLPALKATVSYPKGGGYANIARAQVSLPKSEFLEQGNIGLACTKPVLQARACPAKSVYGTAKAWSPLLEKPLEGPVYLVGGYGYKLPAMVAELDGQIRVLLVGKIDTGPSKGIRNTFEAVPDAPVEKFTLELKGGKKYGLLVNSENLCKAKQVGQASFTAQNGKTLALKPTIANSCGKSKKHKGKKGAKGNGHKKGAQGPGSKKKH